MRFIIFRCLYEHFCSGFNELIWLDIVTNVDRFGMFIKVSGYKEFILLVVI